MNAQFFGKAGLPFGGAWFTASFLTLGSLLARDQPDIVWSRSGHSGTCPLAFSSNGWLLAAGTTEQDPVIGTSSYAVRIWRVADGRLLKSIDAQASPTSVAFSPDGTLLAAGGFDDLIRVWRLSDSELLCSQTKGDVVCVAFSADGTLATWASDESTIELWRVPEGTRLRTLTGRSWS